jgi:hypothetical protein
MKSWILEKSVLSTILSLQKNQQKIAKIRDLELGKEI